MVSGSPDCPGLTSTQSPTVGWVGPKFVASSRSEFDSDSFVLANAAKVLTARYSPSPVCTDVVIPSILTTLPGTRAGSRSVICLKWALTGSVRP